MTNNPTHCDCCGAPTLASYSDGKGQWLCGPCLADLTEPLPPRDEDQCVDTCHTRYKAATASVYLGAVRVRLCAECVAAAEGHSARVLWDRDIQNKATSPAPSANGVRAVAPARACKSNMNRRGGKNSAYDDPRYLRPLRPLPALRPSLRPGHYEPGAGVPAVLGRRHHRLRVRAV